MILVPVSVTIIPWRVDGAGGLDPAAPPADWTAELETLAADILERRT